MTPAEADRVRRACNAAIDQLIVNGLVEPVDVLNTIDVLLHALGKMTKHERATLLRMLEDLGKAVHGDGS